jgi:hypothetical protein
VKERVQDKEREPYNFELNISESFEIFSSNFVCANII